MYCTLAVAGCTVRGGGGGGGCSALGVVVYTCTLCSVGVESVFIGGGGRIGGPWASRRLAVCPVAGVGARGRTLGHVLVLMFS